MQLPYATRISQIEIWQPRWKDRVVLIAKYKVSSHNCITFTKTPSMKDKYYLSGETIINSPLETNGKIACYAVSMDELETLEIV
jgi:hypothetical protein